MQTSVDTSEPGPRIVREGCKLGWQVRVIRQTMQKICEVVSAHHHFNLLVDVFAFPKNRRRVSNVEVTDDIEGLLILLGNRVASVGSDIAVRCAKMVKRSSD